MESWIILATIVLFIYWFLTRNFNIFKHLSIPYVKPIPIFGNMRRIILGIETIQSTVQRTYECHPEARYVGFFEFSTPLIILKDLDLVKSITIRNFDSFPNHRLVLDSPNEPLFQKNLVALKNDAWRDMRALLSPAFTSSKMKMMFTAISQCAANLADHLVKLDSQSAELDVKDTFRRYTLDVMATSAFGISVNSMEDRDNEFYLLGKSLSDFSGWRIVKVFLIRSCPWLAKLFNVRLIDEKTSNFFTNIIQSTIATRDAQGIFRPDMIHLMMEARDRAEKSPLSPADIAAQAFIFLLGGAESPAATTSFAALLLALNPDAQRKLQAEIDRVLEQNSGQVSFENLHAMEYLDAVVNETLRMYSPGFLLDRIGDKSFTLPPALPGLDPLEMKPGQNIWIPVHSIHHDPKHFRNPEKFDPERFNGANKSKMNPLAFIPFGAGPRMCIANRFALMEIKTALFHVLAKCNLLTTPKTPKSVHLSPGTFLITPNGGFWLKVEPRCM